MPRLLGTLCFSLMMLGLVPRSLPAETIFDTPAVLVPGVYEGWDQGPNARYLEEEGTAIVLENDELDRLTAVVAELFADETKREAMSEAARRLARPDAARRIARMLRDISVEGVAA